MANFSKYFYEANKGKTCSDWTHPGITCEHFAFTTFRDGWLGGSQYYLPSIVLPAMFKWDKWSKAFWAKILKDYITSIMFGASVNIFVAFGSFCMFYKMMRNFEPVFVFVPCFLGSIFCYFMPAHITEIQCIGAVNMVLDTLLRGSSSAVVQWCRKSTLVTTLVFMASTGGICHVLKKGLSRRYWFLNVMPCIATGDEDNKSNGVVPQIKDESKWMNKIIRNEYQVCRHPTSCDRFILEEVKRTAIFSFLFGLANCLAESGNFKKGIREFPSLFVKNFDYGLFFFLTIYSGLYRFGNCLLNRYTGKDEAKNSTVAALISGVAFCIYPKFLILSFGFVRAVQLSAMDFIQRHKEDSAWVRALDRFPTSWLLYSVATAYAYQCRVFYPDITPTYIHQIMSIGTGNRSDTLAKSYAAILMGLK